MTSLDVIVSLIGASAPDCRFFDGFIATARGDVLSWLKVATAQWQEWLKAWKNQEREFDDEGVMAMKVELFVKTPSDSIRAKFGHQQPTKKHGSIV